MEQKKISMKMINDNKSDMNDNKIEIKDNKMSVEEVEDQEVGLFLGGLPIHSQVMKIKQEIEKIKHPSLQQQEMRRVLLRATHDRPQRSRSPLGSPDRGRPTLFTIDFPSG
ncbi:hypothetical protein TIFTF001_007682 [Ficus carica]|uniref:Uncharacterized protein n=1 Tax=Ficus carica TaxID=3494 RepID=A0AA88DGL0_FICCA|nr:hypothetical protein TIFTF001_007682 [Ficus carica]